MKFIFNLEPYPKRTATFGMRGRYPVVVKNKKTTEFESNLKQMCSLQYKNPPLSGALSVKIGFFLTKPKSVKREYVCVKPDIDNLLKSSFDAMNGTLWEDDSQIVSVEAVKRYSSGQGFIVLEVEVIV